MENTEQLAHEFWELIVYAEGLKSYSEAELSSPMQRGNGLRKRSWRILGSGINIISRTRFLR